MARRLWKASGLQLRGIFILPEVRLREYGLDRSIILPLTRTGYVISAPLATRHSGEWTQGGGELREGGAPMKRIRTVVILLLGAALSLGLVPLAMAGQPTHTKTQLYEGQNKWVKIDKCGLQPGTCEGSVIVAPQGGGSEVALAIKPGTWIK